ncbi:alpha/beta fold hydrolase [Acuticoccus sp. M5D2P5]|uniref:alpha/beta fold hydrolase n=1 Tax=Acuticoccus kalidii TaxID=2910977 RepID=UPI001F24903F|nr:alpha/beta fold hydrolase [Acuticoccus kalidii]MCF3933802.1 alpha/beta fold hydrolase [Acuticoccus kalidii]
MAAPLVPLPHTSRGHASPPIVLLHGFGGDQLAWMGLAGPLSKLRRTIAFDLPGHGAAVNWPEVASVSVSANAVIESLDRMAVERATIVGHSMGGAVASLVGLKRPDLVERLVLLAPGGFGPEMNVRLLTRYAAMTEADEIAVVMEQFFAPTSTIPPVLTQLVVEQRADPAIQASFKAIVSVISDGAGQGTLPLDDLAAAPFPTSLVWGLEDAVLPVRQAIEAPAAIARHLVPDCGHMVHMEASELVMGILTKALTGRAPA